MLDFLFKRLFIISLLLNPMCMAMSVSSKLKISKLAFPFESDITPRLALVFEIIFTSAIGVLFSAFTKVMF